MKLPTHYNELLTMGQLQSARAQLRASPDGHVTVVTHGALKRFFKPLVALVRSQSARDSHRAGAHAYVAYVRQTQGFEAARFAESALSNRIDRGKPVSMRKIRTLETAWQAAGKMPGIPGQREFKKEHLVDAGEHLGSGANNRVIQATFDNGKEVMTGALKPLSGSSGAMMLDGRDDDLGVDTYVLDRNLASQRLAERLGTHVIAGGVPAQTAKGQPALLMELVHGDAVTDRVKSGQAVRDSAELRRGLVGLQLVDILSAQTDRNLSNILLKRESGRDIPVGIDNDISFITAPNIAVLSERINMEAKPCGLPVVMDQSMCRHVSSMTPQDLVTIMGPNLATPGRLAAAASRLAELQAHIQSGNVLVVEDQDWNNSMVEQALANDVGNYWHQVMTARPD